MSEVKQVSSWDDLDGVEKGERKVITLPKATRIQGKDVNVEIRALTPPELVSATDFPLAQVMDLITEEDNKKEIMESAWEDNIKGKEVKQILTMIGETLKLGVCNPVIETNEHLLKLQQDSFYIFSEIVHMSVSKRKVDSAASFPVNG